MATAIAQQTVVRGGGARTVSLPAPCNAGSLLLVAYAGADSLGTVRIGGLVYPRAINLFSPVIGGVWGAWVGSLCLGREQMVTLVPSSQTAPWTAVIMEISGEAHAQPYNYDGAGATGDGATPVSFTPPTTVDPAFMIVMYFELAALFVTVGDGWTDLDQASFAGPTSAVTVATDAKSYPTPGVQAATTWTETPATGVQWATYLLVLYDLGRRPGQSLAHISGGGAQLAIPGHTEAPIPIDPTDIPLPPLARPPQPVVIPETPWIPQPGRPYRRTR